MSRVNGFFARWFSDIERDQENYFGAKPDGGERWVQASRSILENIDAYGHETFPAIDDECNEAWINSPVTKKIGSETQELAPAQGTVRSRECLLRETYGSARRCGAQIPDPMGAVDDCDTSNPESVIRTWQPRCWSERDLQSLARVRPLVEECVALAQPIDADDARRLMRYSALMAVWTDHKTGDAHRESIFDESNLVHWLEELADPPPSADGSLVAPLKSSTWCGVADHVIRRVGRVAHPEGWSKKPPKRRTPDPPLPYSEAEEYAYQRAISRVRKADAAAQWWVGSGSLGGGLNGPDLAASCVEDVTTVDGGGLIVEVRGANPREVPILSRYAPLVRQAMDAAGSGPFITSKRNSPAGGIASSIIVGGNGLSLPRARATWLRTQLRSGIGYVDLCAIAGSVAKDRINRLVADAVAEVDPHEAAVRALGP